MSAVLKYIRVWGVVVVGAGRQEPIAEIRGERMAWNRVVEGGW